MRVSVMTCLLPGCAHATTIQALTPLQNVTHVLLGHARLAAHIGCLELLPHRDQQLAQALNVLGTRVLVLLQQALDAAAWCGVLCGAVAEASAGQHSLVTRTFDAGAMPRAMQAVTPPARNQPYRATPAPVHDVFGQHAKAVQLTDVLDVAQRAPPRLELLCCCCRLSAPLGQLLSLGGVLELLVGCLGVGR